jgi:hypothetical protein
MMTLKIWIIRIILLFTLIPRASGSATPPFRLMTVDTASLPHKKYVAGLNEVGIRIGPVFLDTHPLLDALAAGNVGTKLSVGVNDKLSFAAGARYIQFFGGETVSQIAIAKNSALTKFELNFRGYTSYLTSTYHFAKISSHLTLQGADVSGSRIFGLVSALDFALSDNWRAAVEAGYEFKARTPRASLGFVRTGPTFGTRLGITYVDLKDSFVHYAGVVPVLDFYWSLGGGDS